MYSGYINSALGHMNSEDIDARSALEEVELEAIDRLAIADAARDEIQVIVAAPELEAPLPEGQIALKFGVMSLTAQFSNLQQW
jgi:hypothetical protein